MLPAEIALETPALSERVIRHKFSCQMSLSHQVKILSKWNDTGLFSPHLIIYVLWVNEKGVQKEPSINWCTLMQRKVWQLNWYDQQQGHVISLFVSPSSSLELVGTVTREEHRSSGRQNLHLFQIVMLFWIALLAWQHYAWTARGNNSEQ